MPYKQWNPKSYYTNSGSGRQSSRRGALSDVYNDGSEDGRLCLGGYKYTILAVLVWLVFFKYGDWFRRSDDLCHDCIEWVDAPKGVVIDENATLDIVGRVTDGHVRVHRSDNRWGVIETKVMASSEDLAKQFKSIVATSGSTTKVRLEFPLDLHWRDKIEVEVDIWLPHVSAGKQLQVEKSWSGNNLRLQTTNGPIRSQSAAVVAGEIVSWKTKNGLIRAESIIAGESVDLLTTNGEVMVKRSVKAGNAVTVSSSNGEIRIGIIATHMARIKTSNASIELNRVNAADALVETSNGLIQANLYGSQEDSQFVLTTSNARVRVYVGGLTGPSPRLTIQTSNAPFFVEVV
ncbi:hypothetical protein BX666DRAFT_1321106 [Dichotomocladium elegans]|nr:hypothetical protein BX666DRAFT_1321106 [Dichotomocladium elegans]